MKAKKPAKSVPAKASKPKSGGLLSKLKGALAKKPAVKPAAKPKAAAKPAAKKAAPKAVKPVKPAPAKKPAPVAKKPVVAVKPVAKPAAKPAKVEAPKPVTKPVAAKPAPVAVAKPVVAAKPLPKPAPRKASRTINGALTEDDIRDMSDDEYMNDAQLDFFRVRLLQMRQEVLQREVDVKERLHEREVFADPADRATAEEEHWLDLRLRERESLLLKKIDDALRRLENKEYGYCEKTGDPIGIPRLLARPTATVCVDIKGQDERVEAQFRDR